MSRTATYGELDSPLHGTKEGEFPFPDTNATHPWWLLTIWWMTPFPGLVKLYASTTRYGCPPNPRLWRSQREVTHFNSMNHKGTACTTIRPKRILPFSASSKIRSINSDTWNVKQNTAKSKNFLKERVYWGTWQSEKGPSPRACSLNYLQQG